MTDALPTPPPPTVPLDEPIFGAATSYLQEHSDLQPEEIERVVLAFKTRHPTEYTASLGASTASSLPQAVRGPLHTLARVWFGERGGVSTPPGIVAIWEDVLPGEEGGAPAVLDRLGSAGGSLSRPTTSTSAATSAAPDLHSACHDGGQPSAQPTPMAIEGGCLRSPGPGVGPRRSLRLHNTPGAWYAAGSPPPPPPTQRQAIPSRPGDSGSCRGRQRQ